MGLIMDGNNRRTAWQRTGGNTSRFIVTEDVEVPAWYAQLSTAINAYPPQQIGTSAANVYSVTCVGAQAAKEVTAYVQSHSQPHPFHGSVIRGVFGGLLE